MSYFLSIVIVIVLVFGGAAVFFVRHSLAGGEDQGIVWYESSVTGRLYVGDTFVGFVSRVDAHGAPWVDKNGRKVQEESLYRDEQAKVWRFRLDHQPFVSVK